MSFDFIPELSLLGRVLASLALVILAMAISRWQQAQLESSLLVATVRAFVQLIAIGFALDFIFGQDNVWWVLAVLSVMIMIAAYTAGQRAAHVPHAHWIALAAIGLGAGFTIGSLLVLRVFTFDAHTMIPIGGMIIGSAMTTAALALSRLQEDFHDHVGQIEEALALGGTSQQAAQPQFRRAIRTAMLPAIESTKVVGIIKLPGAMTGLILAGTPPLEAVQIQIIVMYMLIGAEAFTGLITAYLTCRQFFTPAHQLIEGWE